MLDIDAIKRRLLIKYPLFGAIVANLNYVEDYDCRDYHGNPTLGTNGKTIYYHPDFVGGLSSDEQIFAFAHEVCHIAFDHIYRSKDKDPETWNIATDAVINASLKADGLTLIDGVVDIPRALHYSAEEMYTELLNEKNNSSSQTTPSNNDQGSPDGNNSSSTKKDKANDVGHDTHSMWSQALEDKMDKDSLEKDSNQQDSKAKKKSLFEKIFKNKKPKNSVDSENKQTSEQRERDKKIEEQIKRLSTLGEKKVFEQNKVERKKQMDALMDTLTKESIGSSSANDSPQRRVENIGIAKPLIDWRKLLREAISVEVDWSYANAIIEDGVVTPHLEDIPRPKTEILLDTSGSIDEQLLRNFLRECKNILANSKVKVGCFDDKFYGFHDIRTESDIDNMPFHGGGGTNFNVAVRAFSRRVENKIIFTDGLSQMPDMQMDAIWIVFGGRVINPPGGRVIQITDQQLNELYSRGMSNKLR